MAQPRYHQQGRFYESEFPDIDELVIVRVEKVDDKAGAYVSLLEYNNREGMINLGEISKRRIRSMAKLLRVGSHEVCMVVSVDEEKGYINLSKKRVATEDIAPKTELFAKAKAIHGIMQHVASLHEVQIDELCNKVSWPLHQSHSTALDGFKKHVAGEINIWEEIDWSSPGQDLTDLADKLKADIEIHLQRRLIQAQVRLQAKCEVSCSAYDGIDAVKDSLMEGFKASTEDHKVDIKLIAHPLFALSCLSRDKEAGIATLDNAMMKIEEAILKRSGNFKITAKPTFVQDEDTKEEKGSEESGSDSDSSGEDEQDETMGDLDEAQLAELAKKKLDDSDDEGSK